LRANDVSLASLGSLYLLRTNAPTAGLQATVVKACAAGLLYLGQNDTYQKRIRGNIPGVVDFEKTLLSKCTTCDGAKTITSACPKCAGDGKCKITSCRDGTSEFTSFEGRVEYRRCAICKGTGQCAECQGKERITKKCLACQGHGGHFSKSVALDEYKNQVEIAIVEFENIRHNEEKRSTQQQFEAKMRETEIGAKREALLVEAKATGEERARQAALITREEAERERKQAEDTKYATFDKDYLKSVVVIEGDRGAGTGFLCEFKGKKVLLSNAHVLCGNRKLRIRTIDGEDLKYTKINVCRERDIVAYELDNTENLVWLKTHQNNDINNQEPIVVFGNSAGGGVVTTLRGKMQGIGPDKIEVDATFVHGNSGSPIIAYPYNAVVGMATYATKEPNVDWAKRSTRFAEVRRFGVRIDNVEWESFFILDDNEYNKALDVYDAIITFADSEVMKAKWQGDYYRATGQTKTTAVRLRDQYWATPEWMRKYADEAALAAYVCKLILE
jgi:S1-C subfamily serine protease